MSYFSLKIDNFDDGFSKMEYIVKSFKLVSNNEIF